MRRWGWALFLVATTLAAGCGNGAHDLGRATQTATGPPPITASGARTAELAAGGGATETRIVRFNPTLPSGGEREGSCWTRSLADRRADAWRCMIGNQISDPCFTVPGSEALVCGANPRTGEPGFALTLAKPLPDEKMATPAADNWAWMLELADGTFCSFATGATGGVNGKRLNYSCAGRGGTDYVMILGDLQPGSVWTAEKVVVSSGANGLSLKQSEVLPIRTVWQ